MSNNNQNIRAVPEREATTSVQVSNLLNIAGTMMAALLAPNHNIVEPHHSKPELDGGCKSAAEMTFIECCNALTDIVRDKTRWNLTLQRALEIQTLKINQAHIEVLAAQKQSIESLAKPSSRFHPSLVRMTDGMYAAYLGDIDNPETALVGIGRTAELAFEAFDSLFAGQVPSDMLEWLHTQKQKLKQNNEKTIEAEIVDAQRTSKTKKRKAKRNKPRGDSPYSPAD